jgi:hypothetical protein
MRVLLGVLFAAGSLVIGAVTACLTAINRVRGAELDERQHECEANWRRNELIRQEIGTGEWRLMHGAEEQPEEEQAEPRPRIEH